MYVMYRTKECFHFSTLSTKNWNVRHEHGHCDPYGWWLNAKTALRMYVVEDLCQPSEEPHSDVESETGSIHGALAFSHLLSKMKPRMTSCSMIWLAMMDVGKREISNDSTRFLDLFEIQV